MKTVVIGLGYVGLVIAARAARVGHEVVGVEIDPEKRAMLHANKSYIEDITSEQLEELGYNFMVVGERMLHEIEHFDIGIIAVPTPLKDGVPDLSYVESAASMLGSYLQQGATVVLESTTYPGTTEGLLANVLERTSGLKAGTEFMLGFSPERIDPGNKTHTFQNTPKIVSGVNDLSLEVIDLFYSSIVDRTIRVTSPRLAEITKLWENIYADVNIALVNEMAQICHRLDIDVWEMIEAGFTKGHSMGDFAWKPGPGVGGHCLPVDPEYLIWLMETEHDMRFRLGAMARETNNFMPEYVVRRCMDLLNVNGKAMSRTRILVIGVTYKAGSNDMRESPSVELVKLLRAKGAIVTISDPYVENWNLTSSVEVEDIAGYEYDLTIVATAHPEYDYNKLARENNLVFDTRGVLPARRNVEYL